MGIPPPSAIYYTINCDGCRHGGEYARIRYHGNAADAFLENRQDPWYPKVAQSMNINMIREIPRGVSTEVFQEHIGDSISPHASPRSFLGSPDGQRAIGGALNGAIRAQESLATYPYFPAGANLLA